MSEDVTTDPVTTDPAPVVDPVEPVTDPVEDPAEDPKEEFDPDKAREKIRKANSEAKALRERAKAAEAERDASKGAGERVTALEAENMRLKVAVKLNGALPADLIERLRGSTEEEMIEDAEKLLAHFEKRKPPTNQPREKLRGGGDPTGTEPALIDSDPDKFAESIFKN